MIGAGPIHSTIVDVPEIRAQMVQTLVLHLVPENPQHSQTQHHWNLTIKLCSVISRTLIGGSYASAEVQSVYSIAPADWTNL